jgi:transcriptional regulator with XRE-family HTH domain
LNSELIRRCILVVGNEPPANNDQPIYKRRRRKRGLLDAIQQSARDGQFIDVGQRLRKLRNERSLSIRALAEKSGLNVNTLSLIENGKTSPSVSTLQQLAITLDVSITAFFDTDAPKKNLTFLKAGKRSLAVFSHGTLEDLGAGMTMGGGLPFVVNLQPHADSGPNAIVHTGYEFVFCLEGRVVYTIEDQSYVLEPGDSLLFEAHLPHRWQNADSTPARSLLVLCPTDEHDRPTERHFTME